jgi:hypothetical protein
MAPKIRERIPSSLMGVTKAKGRTALFQEGFAISGKEFRSRQSVGRWAGAAGLRSRAATFMAASLDKKNGRRRGDGQGWGRPGGLEKPPSPSSYYHISGRLASCRAAPVRGWFSTSVIVAPTQAARQLLAAAHFCRMAGPNAIQPCRESPDRIHPRA